VKQSRVRSLFTLTRPPALLTAPSDTLTGVACASALGAQLEWYTLLSAVCVSLFIYAGGMVMNDVFDATLDAQERPERPIPSGQVSLHLAGSFGVSLHALALLCAWRVSGALLLVSAGVIMMTYAYNALLKESPLGPLAMALCRAGNLWVGVTATGALAHLSSSDTLSVPLSLSAITALYVYSLTSVSRFEVHGGRGAVRWAWMLTLSAALPIGAGLYFPSLNIGVITCGYLLYTLLPFTLKLSRAEGEVTQARGARALVGVGVRGVALLNASWCVALGAWGSALALLTLSYSAGWVARRFATT